MLQGEAVRNVLRAMSDPETGQHIVSLGMVREIEADVQRAVQTLDGAVRVLVDLVEPDEEWPRVADVAEPQAGRATHLSGIVLVTPQELAGMVVRKAANMASQLEVPILGAVEKMSYTVCPHCGERSELFGPSHLQSVCAPLAIPVLARVPIERQIVTLCDEGRTEECRLAPFEDPAEGVLAHLGDRTVARSQPAIVGSQTADATGPTARGGDHVGRYQAVGQSWSKGRQTRRGWPHGWHTRRGTRGQLPLSLLWASSAA